MGVDSPSLKHRVGVSLCFTVGCLGASVAWAQDDDVITLDEIVVRGLVSPTEGLTTITTEQIEREQATTLDELFRNVPGVEGTLGPGRQFADVNIRGVDGAGAVIVSVDGAEKNLVTTRHGVDFNPVFFESGFLKEVNVVKGAASNVFGTGSVGGRIEFETVDPIDITRGDRVGAQITGGAETNGPGFSGSAIGAVQATDSLGLLAGFSYRDFDDYKNGDGDEVLNSGSEVLSALFKSTFAPTDEFEFEFSYLYSRHDYIGANVFGNANNRQDVDNDNEVRDNAVSARAFYAPLDNVSFDIDGFYTTTSHRETVLETRQGSNADPGDFDDRRVVSFGGTAYTTIDLETGPLTHAVQIGGSFTDSNLVFKTEDGGNSPDSSGDSLVYGVFIQNRIRFNDWIELIPGLRYERFDVEGTNGAESSGDKLLPKVTLAVSPFSGVASGLQFFGSYARGLRAPRLNELLVNETSSRTRGGRTTTTITLSNPDLQAEISDQFEVGFRFGADSLLLDGDSLTASFTAFENQISDRIEEVVIATETDGDVTTNTEQLQNVGEATIKGLELAANYDAGDFFIGGTAAFTEGERDDTGEDLNSVRPANGTIFGGVRFLEEALTLGAETELFRGKTEVGNNDVIGEDSSGGAVFNLFGSYDFNDRISVNARVNNVLDRTFQRFDQVDEGLGVNGKITVRVNL